MDLGEALAWLDRHANLEAQPAVAGRVAGLGLGNVRALLDALGDPHLAQPTIHVTGTNGKGSVTLMAERILAAAGLVAGTYTSPHYERINERIARSDEPVPDEDLAGVLTLLADLEPVVLGGGRASWFDLMTVAGFTWFAEQAVDVAVVEVGLLGRWDATNVVESAVGVLTSVGGDHTDFALGWREAVAEEKAGIVKPGSCVVLGDADPLVTGIVAAEVEKVGAAALRVVGRDFDVVASRVAVGGRLLEIVTPRARYADLHLPVHGAHQAANFALALTSVEELVDGPLSVDVVEEAAASISLPGRMEVIGGSPTVVLDGAHNPDAAAALAHGLDDELPGSDEGVRRVLLVGMLVGRDPEPYLSALDVGRFDTVVVTTPPSPRAAPARHVADAVASLGATAEVVDDPERALARSLRLAGEDGLVVVTGSIYLVGALRQVCLRR